MGSFGPDTGENSFEVLENPDRLRAHLVAQVEFFAKSGRDVLQGRQRERRSACEREPSETSSKAELTMSTCFEVPTSG